MSTNFDQHLNEKYGSTAPIAQTVLYLTEDEAEAVKRFEDQGMRHFEAVEAVIPGLVGKVWCWRSADDGIVVNDWHRTDNNL